jgi:predicted  nucleic acid-binding Zn-ribbon protein
MKNAIKIIIIVAVFSFLFGVIVSATGVYLYHKRAVNKLAHEYSELRERKESLERSFKRSELTVESLYAENTKLREAHEGLRRGVRQIGNLSAEFRVIYTRFTEIIDGIEKRSGNIGKESRLLLESMDSYLSIE